MDRSGLAAHRQGVSVSTLAGKSPWRKVEHDGDDYLVRENDGAVWAVRLDAEREVYFWWGETIPVWALAKAEPVQGVLL